MKRVDMSPEAVGGRLDLLDQLWEICMTLSRSQIIDTVETNSDQPEYFGDHYDKTNTEDATKAAS